jgi:uncharacterized protein (TIGR02757 family)
MIFNYRKLEELYSTYNKRDFVSPDPLQFLYNYENLPDREIVALTAASLAYGRVSQILKSVQQILDAISPSPLGFIMEKSDCEVRRTFQSFKHRFTTGDDIAYLFAGIKSALNKYNSLEACFASGYSSNDKNIIPALDHFSTTLCQFFPDRKSYLIPAPQRGSACKRPMLFLRWMVRRDEVDIGGWNTIPKSKLIIPLDTHMHKISTQFGLTSRKSADLKSAVEITGAFSEINPSDPVKYDFALTRFGIRDDMKIEDI